MTEAALMVGLGVLLGLLATTAALLPLWSALALLTGPQPLLVPWTALGVITASCAAIAVCAALVAASPVLRDRRRTRLAAI